MKSQGHLDTDGDDNRGMEEVHLDKSQQGCMCTCECVYVWGEKTKKDNGLHMCVGLSLNYSWFLYIIP